MPFLFLDARWGISGRWKRLFLKEFLILSMWVWNVGIFCKFNPSDKWLMVKKCLQYLEFHSWDVILKRQTLFCSLIKNPFCQAVLTCHNFRLWIVGSWSATSCWRDVSRRGSSCCPSRPSFRTSNVARSCRRRFRRPRLSRLRRRRRGRSRRFFPPTRTVESEKCLF